MLSDTELQLEWAALLNTITHRSVELNKRLNEIADHASRAPTARHLVAVAILHAVMVCETGAAAQLLAVEEERCRAIMRGIWNTADEFLDADPGDPRYKGSPPM